MGRPHQRCPYFNGTYGNVNVELSAGGVLLAAAAKLEA